MNNVEKGFIIYVIAVTVAATYLYKKSSHLETQLTQTKAELQESEDREYGIEAENNRLVGRLRGCEMAQDNLEECQSEKTFTELDLKQCKRELDIAIRYGAKCLKQNLSLLEQLRKRK